MIKEIPRNAQQYLYFEHKGTPVLDALVVAYNGIVKEYVDWANGLGKQTTSWLKWSAALPNGQFLTDGCVDFLSTNLYDLPRPQISSIIQAQSGLYDSLTAKYDNSNTKYDSGVPTSALTPVEMSRFVDWHLYRGDYWIATKPNQYVRYTAPLFFSMAILKQKILRFVIDDLTSYADNPLAMLDALQYIIITRDDANSNETNNVYTVDFNTTDPSSPVNLGLATMFKNLLIAGLLPLPINFYLTAV